MTKYIRGSWRLIYQCKGCAKLGSAYEYICPACGEAESLIRVVGRAVYRKGFFHQHLDSFEKRCIQPSMPSLIKQYPGERDTP